jgi:hypothetical protein
MFFSDLNLEQGKSGQSAQTSKLFFLTQHVMNEHEGCLFKKLGPPHPGHLESPEV